VAELPELLVLAQQMDAELAGRRFSEVEVVQEKCLNLPPTQFASELVGRSVERARNHGKWIFLDLSEGAHLLLNLGMGADTLYYRAGESYDPEHRVRFHFEDGSGFTCRFWWFGHTHLVTTGELAQHSPTVSLGPLALSPEMDRQRFATLLDGGRARVKNVLTDQKRISGIGNVYIQDILFRARVHPLLPVAQLDEAGVDRLYQAMVETLQLAYDKRGLAYERDFYGKPGGVTTDDFLVAYREGKPCPVCGTTIEKIKTGATASFICPQCQPAPG
jgi:formamidopyrimidine-DNA glycosylase